jgi:hypothetical protein
MLKSQSKKFKDNSAFKGKVFEDRLDTIEDKYGKRTRKLVEVKEDESYLEEVDKDTGPITVALEEEANIKKEKKQKEEEMNYLDGLKKDPRSYRINLAEAGMYGLTDIDWPLFWEYHCIPTEQGKTIRVYEKDIQTKDGILFVLRAPNKITYLKGMSCSYDIPVDLKGVEEMLVVVEDTLDSYGRNSGKEIFTGNKKVN